MSVTTCPASAFSGLKFAGVNKNTQHAGAAWKLTEHGMLSSRISVNADRKIADADYARIISAEIEKGASLPLIPQWPAILETFRQSLQAAAAGPKTREQALADAHKEIEAIFALPLGRKETCTRASDRAPWPEALLLRSGIAFPIKPFAALRAMLPHCRRQRRRSRMLGEKWTGYWFVLRGANTLAVILGFPAVTASLESVGLVGRRGGVSLANCTRVLGDVQFPVTTWSTLVFVVAVVSFYLVMGLAVALPLDLDVPGRWVFRVLAIRPWTMPDVIGGLVFRSLFDTLTGGVNVVGIMLGLMQEPKDWLGSPSSALFSVIMEESWRGWPPLRSTLLPDPAGFSHVRHFAAWLGLTPRSHSSGRKERLGWISKMGNEDGVMSNCARQAVGLPPAFAVRCKNPTLIRFQPGQVKPDPGFPTRDGADMVTMHAVEITRPGPADTLQPTERAIPRPGLGEVLIKVAAAGVNRPDVAQRQGKYPAPPGASDLPGLEVAGELVEGAFGGDNPFGLKPGDAVCALLTGGGYAEYAVAPLLQCLPVPKGMTLVEAAALPENYFTVWSNVFERGRLGTTANGTPESLLVQGGSSGIGVTAIQLARAFGHRVFATAGNAEKCAACEKLGAHAINYHEQDFVEEVQQHTHGSGVDVILDMVAGDYVARELGLLAEEGRLVLISDLGGRQAAIDALLIMQRRLTITGSTLRARPIAFKATVARQLHVRVWPLLESGKARPVIHQVFPAREAARAHALMETSAHIGKIMLQW